MKKLILAVSLVCLFAGFAFASDTIKSQTVQDTVTILASGVDTSDSVDLRKDVQGFFSYQIVLTGDGTVTVEYLVSSNGADFLEPQDATDVLTGFTKTSGPNSDGKAIISFTPVVAKWIQIKVTETGGSDSVIVTGELTYE